MTAIVVPRVNTRYFLKFCLPAMFGTLVEYYDYTLYGFFAVILTEQFFPATDPVIGLLKTFGIFVAGSLSKPLGSVIFSQIGDHYGRSPALKFTMLGIALPTIIIGLMPNYGEIGWIAPLILLLCRITQGMFVSGESDGVRIFLYETLGGRFSCTASALSGLACMLGIYLASLAASIITSGNLPIWGWRVPFLMSGILGFLVILCRQYLPETPEFIRYQNAIDIFAHKKNLFQVLLKNKWTVIGAILICGSAGGAYHFYLVFYGTYLHSVLGILDKATAASYTSHAILVFSLTLVLMGVLADYFGKAIIMKIFIGLLCLMVMINFYMIEQGQMPQWVMLCTAFSMTPINTIGLVLVYEKLGVGERFRCSSLGHALGSMLFSGTAPVVSLSLWKMTNYSVVPLIYFLVLSMMGYFAVMRLAKIDFFKKEANA